MLELRLGLIHVHVARLVYLVFDLTCMVLFWSISRFYSVLLDNRTPVMIIKVMLIERLDEALLFSFPVEYNITI